ncbi:MAG: hypothetical protein IT181_25580, partial [Acidobacteria bacterium]|nr:hypothetical protein [Acidobacteriota bacterium]
MSCPDAPARRRRGPGVAALPACLAVLAGLACGQARAVLGEPAGGIQAEGLRLSAAVREQAVPGARVHLLQFADGSTVRQFSGADGRV